MADKSFIIKIEGLDEFTKMMMKYPEISGRNIQDAIGKSIAEIERETVPRTPFDRGRLAGGYREKFSPLRGELYNLVEYAVKQHETLWYHHRVGEAKFLEHGATAASSQIEKYFEQAISDTLNKITK